MFTFAWEHIRPLNKNHCNKVRGLGIFKCSSFEASISINGKTWSFKEGIRSAKVSAQLVRVLTLPFWEDWEPSCFCLIVFYKNVSQIVIDEFWINPIEWDIMKSYTWVIDIIISWVILEWWYHQWSHLPIRTIWLCGQEGTKLLLINYLFILGISQTQLVGGGEYG